MATEFNTGTDASLNEAVKSRYEANTDTNAFTDVEKNKLASLPADAEANTVDSVNGASGSVVLNADDISDDTTAHKFATAAQLSKIDGVEAGATADQSGAEIVSAIDAELGGSTWQSGGGGTVDVVSNVARDRILGRISAGSGDSEELTAADVRTLLNVEDGASADQSGAEIVSAIDAELGGSTWQSGGGGGTTDVVSNVAQNRILGRTASGSGNSEELTAAEVRNLLNVENGASADQTGAEIKTLYEGEGNTNAFTDSEKVKLADAATETRLASTSAGEGAALVGVQDVSGFYTSNDSEGVLAEIGGSLQDLEPWSDQSPVDYLQTNDITERVFAFDAGGSATVARPSGYDSISWYNWFENGHDAPANAGGADQYTLPDGFLTMQGKTADYTFADTDRGTIIRATGNALTFTIDEEAAVPIRHGIAKQPSFGVVNSSGNNLIIQGDTGVTLDGVLNGGVTVPDGGAGLVVRVAADSWVYIGDKS